MKIGLLEELGRFWKARSCFVATILLILLFFHWFVWNLLWILLDDLLPCPCFWTCLLGIICFGGGSSNSKIKITTNYSFFGTKIKAWTFMKLTPFFSFLFFSCLVCFLFYFYFFLPSLTIDSVSWPSKKALSFLHACLSSSFGKRSTHSQKGKNCVESK